MNLFTRNSPYYQLLKYLLFHLKHPVYIYIRNLIRLYNFGAISKTISTHIENWTHVYMNLFTGNSPYYHLLKYLLLLLKHPVYGPKTCSKFEWHETNNHKDRTCRRVHKLQHLFRHETKRTTEIYNHLFSSE